MRVVQIKTGGLMRCCIAAIEQLMGGGNWEPKEGEIIPCRWCRDKMIVRNGVVEWFRGEGKDETVE